MVRKKGALPRRDPNAAGQAHETSVRKVLERAKRRMGGAVDFRPKPTIQIAPGLKLIPDFETTFTVGAISIQCFIECQDRRRSTAEIAHKIQTVRSRTEFSQFIFVYPKSIPLATRRWLHSVGAQAVTLAQLRRVFESLEWQAGPRGALGKDPILHIKSRVKIQADKVKSSSTMLAMTNAYINSGAMDWAFGRQRTVKID